MRRSDPAKNDEGFRMVTRGRRSIVRPQQLIEDPEFGQTSLILETEKNYYAALMEQGCMATEEMNNRQFENTNMGEVACIGAALRGGFENTQE